MVRWVVGSILHGGPIELFLVSGMYVSVCTMVHIKERLLLIGNSCECSGDNGFPL